MGCFIVFGTFLFNIIQSIESNENEKQLQAQVSSLISSNHALTSKVCEVKDLQIKQDGNIKSIYDNLEKLSKTQALGPFLQDTKIEILRKQVIEDSMVKLEKGLQGFSEALKEKNGSKLSDSIKEIRKILPYEPFFRVYDKISRNNYEKELFNGQLKVAQVIRWDWKITGEEYPALFVETGESMRDIKEYGPYNNNMITMLDFPLGRFVQFAFRSKGTGNFEFYPTTIRIGWTIAKKNEDGGWSALPAFAEYDPDFRINARGELEY